MNNKEDQNKIVSEVNDFEKNFKDKKEEKQKRMQQFKEELDLKLECSKQSKKE